MTFKCFFGTAGTYCGRSPWSTHSLSNYSKNLTNYQTSLTSKENNKNGLQQMNILTALTRKGTPPTSFDCKQSYLARWRLRAQRQWIKIEKKRTRGTSRTRADPGIDVKRRCQNYPKRIPIWSQMTPKSSQNHPNMNPRIIWTSS